MTLYTELIDRYNSRDFTDPTQKSCYELELKARCPFRFAIPQERQHFFSHATRSLIVNYILERKRYSDSCDETFAFGMVFEACFRTKRIPHSFVLSAHALLGAHCGF